MFGDLNRAEIIGNITNDLQVRYTGNGSAVVSFGVATNRSYKMGDEWKDETTFHNVVIWGNQAEQIAQRARKGTRIFIAGRLQTRTWDDADGKKNYKTEIVSDTVILLDRYERGPMDSAAASKTYNNEEQPKAKRSKAKPKDDSVIDPDDLPF